MTADNCVAYTVLHGPRWTILRRSYPLPEWSAASSGRWGCRERRNRDSILVRAGHRVAHRASSATSVRSISRLVPAVARGRPLSALPPEGLWVLRQQESIPGYSGALSLAPFRRGRFGTC